MHKIFLCGNVDVGKSTIAGQIIYKSNLYDERTVDSVFRKAIEDKMERWKFARLIDICEEEQRRGKTVSFTEIEFNFNEKKYLMIDTPGHKLYLPSMIEGLTVHDPSTVTGCIIVSAFEGEFNAGWEGGQTKEDLILMRSSGINNFIILVNKMDTLEWNNEIFLKYSNIVSDYMNKNLGVKNIKSFPLSGWTGEGIDEFLNNVPESKIINNLEIYYDTEIIKVNVLLFGFEGLITKGYLMIGHIIDKQKMPINIIVNYIKEGIIKTGDKKAEMILSIPKTNLRKGTRILLRSKDNITIGACVIIGIKPYKN